MKKTIVVTGGSDGLGKAIVESLSKKHNVIILARDEEKMKILADKLSCGYYVCDIRNFSNVCDVFRQIFLCYGKIDVLINNAGTWTYGKLDENSYEDIHNVLEVNLLGTIYCTKAVISHMKEQHEGLIININSQSGITSKAERSIYHASKWGLTGFSRSLQLEVSEYGIRITDIMPGRMKTELFRKNGISKIPSGLDVSEVVHLVQFLLEMPNSVWIPEVGIRDIHY